MTNKKIGILGGMGPVAGVYFAQQLIELNASANHDAGHVPFVLYSDPHVPSRVDAFLGGDADPVPFIIDSLNKLHLNGADFGIIVCNTAHIYFDEIAANTRLPLVNMVESTVSHVLANQTNKTIGLLATAATMKSGLYTRAFEAHDKELIVPENEDQEIISDAIFNPAYGIKATRTSPSTKACRAIAEVARKMRDRHGVECLLLGCTELSFTIPLESWEGFEIIDPVKILARTCLTRAGFQASHRNENF